MHMVICCLVYAPNKEEALTKAKGVLDRLCGEHDEPFDCYTTFDNEGSPVSGKGRWGNLPAVVRADSPEGKKFIDEGMKATRDEFMENMRRIRRGLDNMTDDDLFSEELVSHDARAKKVFDPKPDAFDYNPRMIKHLMHSAGQYVGPEIFLYDNDGSGIRSPKHLKDVLNKWPTLYDGSGKENPYKFFHTWVIPADVHY